jgi:hypothetical protein
MSSHLPWDNPALQVRSDPPLRARHRLLQSWFRQHRLHASFGFFRGRPVGSLLAQADVEDSPDLNFYSTPVAMYAKERAVEVAREGGTLAPDRLRRNMLSSMPLCFNLFGALRDDRPTLSQLLREGLEIPVGEVQDVVCEWAPPKHEHLGDRTAFDCFIPLSSTAGESSFLGIETKYTEPFSPKVHDRPSYREASAASGWFLDGAPDTLRDRFTNQLWRNALLTTSLSRQGSFGDGWSVILVLDADDRAREARAILDSHLTTDARIRWSTYEWLVDVAAGMPPLEGWARWFRDRYLDLSPIKGPT